MALAVEENTISLPEVEKDFSRIKDLIQRKGAAIVTENNIPMYIVVEFPKKQAHSFKPADRSEVLSIAERILNEHPHAFEVLAQ
jgi:hypothetical protein